MGSDAGIHYARRFYLQALRERYPKSFLQRWPFIKMHEIYNTSKIGFNYSIHQDINMRTFEVMSCGSLLLTNEIKDPMLKELFKEGEDLIIYRNFDDLCEKVDYFLVHDQERQKISDRGHQKVIQNHTYQHRADEILKIVEEHL